MPGELEELTCWENQVVMLVCFHRLDDKTVYSDLHQIQEQMRKRPNNGFVDFELQKKMNEILLLMKWKWMLRAKPRSDEQKLHRRRNVTRGLLQNEADKTTTVNLRVGFAKEGHRVLLLQAGGLDMPAALW